MIAQIRVKRTRTIHGQMPRMVEHRKLRATMMATKTRKAHHEKSRQELPRNPSSPQGSGLGGWAVVVELRVPEVQDPDPTLRP